MIGTLSQALPKAPPRDTAKGILSLWNPGGGFKGVNPFASCKSGAFAGARGRATQKEKSLRKIVNSFFVLIIQRQQQLLQRELLLC